MKIDITGVENIEAMLDERMNEIENIDVVIGRACALVERSAKQKAPAGTGELRRSITSKVIRLGNRIEGVVFTPVEYAPYVEFGTGLFAENGGRSDVPWVYRADNGEFYSTYGMHPQPFMRPAFNENKAQIIKMLKGV